MTSERLSDDCRNESPDPVKSTNCLGQLLREVGHKRVPEPPASNIGTSVVMNGFSFID